MYWDLSDLLPSLDDEHTKPVFDRLDAAVVDVEAVKGRLDKLTRDDVAAVLDTLARASEAAGRLGARGSLAFAVDTTDDDAKTFMERTRAVSTEAGNRMRFFSHWLKNLSDARAAEVTPEDPQLAHYVRTVRQAKPFTLAERIEEVIADKDMAGISAVVQAREILTSSLRFTDPKTGEAVTQSDIVKHVHAPDPELRRAAYKEMFRVFGEHEGLLAHLYRSVVRDWHVENLKHRQYPRAMTPMNLANEVTDEVVEVMLERCVARRGIWQDFFKWKADQLGEPFDRQDIYAPLEEDPLEVPYEQARSTVLDVFEGFHPRYRELAQRVFDEAHVDPFPGPNKRGGAFCSTPITDMTPFVLLNHTDDARSVSTMAHELGHAIHSMLAADVHPLVASAPLPLAETASVFSELLLHHHLVAGHPEAAQALTAERVSDLYATIQRQAYFARFEIEAHELIPDGAPNAKVRKVYLAQLREQFGDAVHVPEMFANEWLLIPHFNASPFYVSSYSFGALLSLSLYQRYQEDASFNETVIEILSAGGSRDPQELLAEHDIDIASGRFWDRGLDVVEEMVGSLRSR